MKATERAYRNLETFLNFSGFELTENSFGKQVRIRAKTAYIGVQVYEKHDRYEYTDQPKETRIHGHLEVKVSISRMGGEMTAEDFAEAARQMTAAQELLENLEGANLTFIADVNGEEVAA